MNLIKGNRSLLFAAIALMMLAITSACNMTANRDLDFSRSAHDHQDAVARISSDGIEMLKPIDELILVFDDYLKEWVGETYRFVKQEELEHQSINSAVNLATLEYIEVQMFGSENHLPRLVLKGNRADGTCILSARPLVEAEGYLVAISNLSNDPALLPQQCVQADGTISPLCSGGSGCNYTHSCSGVNCSSCSLTISDDGCTGSCRCTRHGSAWGGHSYCNHSVSSN